MNFVIGLFNLENMENYEISAELKEQLDQEVSNLKETDPFIEQRVKFLLTHDLIEIFDEILNNKDTNINYSLPIE